MVSRSKAVVLVAFLLLGASLLKGGLNGNVVSETCCTGPECTLENTCSFLQEPAQARVEQGLLGSGIVALAALLLAAEAFHVKQKEEKKKRLRVV